MILEQVDAQFLRKDTALKAEKISSLNKIILKQADSQSKTESIVKRPLAATGKQLPAPSFFKKPDDTPSKYNSL